MSKKEIRQKNITPSMNSQGFTGIKCMSDESDEGWKEGIEDAPLIKLSRKMRRSINKIKTNAFEGLTEKEVASVVTSFSGVNNEGIKLNVMTGRGIHKNKNYKK
tara:strand:+ start:465 stop:776 length:312 start_codon:yes stop_codon:yes gene_type:complete